MSLQGLLIAVGDAMRDRHIPGTVSGTRMLERYGMVFRHTETGMSVEVTEDASPHELYDALDRLLDDVDRHYRVDEIEARERFQEPHMVLL